MKKLILENPIISFFGLVFFLSWTLWIGVGLFAPQLFILATLMGAWSPSIVALYLLYLRGGKKEVVSFLKMSLVRFKWYWLLIVLFSVPVISFISIQVYQILWDTKISLKYPEGIPLNTPWIVVALIGFVVGIFFGGPLAEDIGWRGFILPELHKTNTALKSAIIVGIAWVLWHIPFFWFEEGAKVVGYFDFSWFAISTILWSILFAWVYFNTKNILLPVFYHASINTTLGFLDLFNTSSGINNKPLLHIHTGITFLIVIIVVLIYGPKKLTKN